MTARIISPLILTAAALAAAVALAPVAAAGSNDAECDRRGGAAVCQKSGHAFIDASPEATRTGVGNWPFGAGPMPPIWAVG